MKPDTCVVCHKISASDCTKPHKLKPHCGASDPEHKENPFDNFRNK